MIDSYNQHHTGWARFSDDKVMRYRLAVSLTGEPVETIPRSQTVVFVMLNPSTADAFVLDPTIRRCVSFARSWDASAVEVVNLFALRSTSPDALYPRATLVVRIGDRADGDIGGGLDNDEQVLMACSGAHRVVAAWGKHGALGRRGDHVRQMLTSRGIQLYRLAGNQDGSPKHPLYIKGGTPPVLWT